MIICCFVFFFQSAEAEATLLKKKCQEINYQLVETLFELIHGVKQIMKKLSPDFRALVIWSNEELSLGENHKIGLKLTSKNQNMQNSIKLQNYSKQK